MAMVQPSFQIMEGPTGAQPASRLTQMQARFQQKQLQEKEQKMLQLYESQTQRAFQRVVRGGGSGDAPGGGKVRQLFDERRRNPRAPLDPLPRPRPRERSPPEEDEDSEPDFGMAALSVDEPAFRKLPNVGPAAEDRRAPVVEDRKSQANVVDADNRFRTYNASKRQPARQPAKQTKAVPQQASVITNTRRVPASKSFPAGMAQARPPSTGMAQQVTRKPGVTGSQPRPSANQPSRPAGNLKPFPPAAASTPTKPRVPVVVATKDDNLAACRICGRHFASDRIQKHEEICQKTTTKKRKAFDPVKQRVKGTEAEAFVMRQLKRGGGVQPRQSQSKKPDWRKKHEEFIATIRAAKEMKAHLAKGGKLADLPPPPPLDTSDYVQCPHCNRRFNEQAAERHIPRCANMIHNKPKPGIPPQRSVTRKR